MSKRLLIPLTMVMGCSGCIAAVPLVTGAAVMGGSAYAVNKSVDGAVENAVRAEQMNCSQLQQEYNRIKNNTAAQFNPFAQTSVKKASIIDVARAKGCRLKI